MSKTNLDRLFKVDEKIASEGMDFAIDEKTSFRIRHFSSSNPRVKAAMATYYKPYARQVSLGTLDQKKELEINVRVFIDTCLVSWEGVEGDDGKEIPFSKESALELFTRLPALFNALWEHANDFKNYKEDLGNF